MKRRIIGWIVVILTTAIVVSCGFSLLIYKSTNSIPEWIKGTLMIRSLGSDGLSAVDSPANQYICAFDFSNNTIDSIQIPLHAQLISHKDGPVILYERNGIYRPGEVVNRRGAYRTYLVGDVRKGVKSYEIERHSDLDEFTFSVQPIVVYGIAGEKASDWGEAANGSYYYLGYGVSENGELEYQLLREKITGELTVYRGYPLDYFVSNIFVSISPSGKIAWREMDGNGGADVFVSDGQDIISLPDEQQYTDSICWIDDNRLLYTADNTDMSGFQWGSPLKIVPRIWNVDTGVIEDLNSIWKDTEVVFPHSLQAMTVNQNKSLVAGYVSPTEEDAGQMGKIVVFSLISGDSYTYVPWNRTISTGNGYYAKYMKDDKGIAIYDPGAATDIHLVWGNEE